MYGNGTYGANWEADAHCDTSLNGPPVTIGSEPSQTYDCGPVAVRGERLQSYESAIHAANANAKVCAILTTPGFWPDGVTNSEYPQSLEPDRAHRARQPDPVRRSCTTTRAGRHDRRDADRSQ